VSEINAHFLNDVRVYRDGLQDSSIQQVREEFQPETPEADFNLVARLLAERYTAEQERLPLMRAVAPALGVLAAQRQLPSDVYFERVTRGSRRIFASPADNVVHRTEAWMFWGQRGNYERYRNRPRVLDVFNADGARGVALTPTGGLMEFYAEPPRGDEPIRAVTHRNSRHEGGGRALGPVPSMELGAGNMLFVYHGLVTFAADRLQVGA
jgi:hypothetical protein